MNQKWIKVAGTIAVLAFSGAGLSRASVMITDDGLGGTSTPTSQTLGYSFVVGDNSLAVSALGVWDSGADGLANVHDIGIWRTDGSLVASAQVPVNGSLDGEFRYVSISPVTLSNNTSYVIGALYPAGNTDLSHGQSGNVQADGKDVGFWNGSGWIYNPALTAADAAYNFRGLWVTGASLTKPAGGNFEGAIYVGPNFAYTEIIPEPGVMLLLACGGVVLWRARRR